LAQNALSLEDAIDTGLNHSIKGLDVFETVLQFVGIFRIEKFVANKASNRLAELLFRELMDAVSTRYLDRNQVLQKINAFQCSSFCVHVSTPLTTLEVFCRIQSNNFKRLGNFV